MKMSKNFKLYALVWAILLVLFNVIVFVTPSEYEGVSKFTESFWIGYTLVTIGFLGQLACSYIGLKDDNLNKVFFNIPLLRISIIGLVVSAVAGSVFMAIPTIESWIAAIISVVILAFVAIATIKAKAVGDIAETIEKKIRTELKKMLNNEREVYEEFFNNFGLQLKFGIYNSYGMNKDDLKDLIMFKSTFENKYVTLEEYVQRMGESQDMIYYACGETVEKIDMLPQMDAVKEKGYEILYLTENVDEFALKILMEYNGKKFINICDEALNLDTEDEKKALKEENEAAKDMFGAMKEAIGDKIQTVRFTNKLKNHPVCLASEGGISLEMEKTLNSMPGAGENKVKAQLCLEINAGHPIADKLKELYNTDKETLKDYSKLLYGEACLISGAGIDDPVEHSNLVCRLMTEK